MRMICFLFIFSIFSTQGFAHEVTESSNCKRLTKVCVITDDDSRVGGSLKEVYILLFNKEGDQVSEQRVASALSIETALIILNSRTCGE